MTFEAHLRDRLHALDRDGLLRVPRTHAASQAPDLSIDGRRVLNLCSPLAQNVAKLAPGFVGTFHWLSVLFALSLTVGWIFLVARSERSTLRSLTHWAAGLTVTWGLTMTLAIDWIDYGKTYRSVAIALRKQLPADLDCLESRGLGETQRAVFHYHAGLITQRAEVHGVTGCRWLLVQAPAIRRPSDNPGTQWTEVWEGRRPRDAERYRLYVRN
jgi:hypothetical protein